MAEAHKYRVLRTLSTGEAPGETVTLSPRAARYLLASGHIEPADGSKAGRGRKKEAVE